jgi:TetR/AcrR family tetracycline transcriptional repressor
MISHVASRVSLSRELVAERAVGLADAEGLDAITIRRLATELGVTPMALYWHYKTKDDLLDAAADRVLADLDLPASTAPSWPVELRVLLEGLLHALGPHPQLADRVASRILSTEHGLQLAERTLQVLALAGFSTVQAAQLAGHALRTVISLVTSDIVDGSGSSAEDRAEQLRHKSVTLGSLPPARYPRVVESALAMTYCPEPAEYFAFGIDHFVAGVAGLAPAGAGRFPESARPDQGSSSSAQ